VKQARSAASSSGTMTAVSHRGPDAGSVIAFAPARKPAIDAVKAS
jgi:hypothetical protein